MMIKSRIRNHRRSVGAVFSGPISDINQRQSANSNSNNQIQCNKSKLPTFKQRYDNASSLSKKYWKSKLNRRRSTSILNNDKVEFLNNCDKNLNDNSNCDSNCDRVDHDNDTPFDQLTKTLKWVDQQYQEFSNANDNDLYFLFNKSMKNGCQSPRSFSKTQNDFSKSQRVLLSPMHKKGRCKENSMWVAFMDRQGCVYVIFIEEHKSLVKSKNIKWYDVLKQNKILGGIGWSEIDDQLLHSFIKSFHKSITSQS